MQKVAPCGGFFAFLLFFSSPSIGGKGAGCEKIPKEWQKALAKCARFSYNNILYYHL
jgi:hypothetical protein